MDAIFGKSVCSKCGYKHATNNVAKDESTKFFLCERCGYQQTSSNGEAMEMIGVGAYTFVSKGDVIIGGGAFESKEIFFSKSKQLLQAVKGARLFYSEKAGNSDKYYLVNYNSKKRFEFCDDDIICWNGLKKAPPTNNLNVTFIKK